MLTRARFSVWVVSCASVLEDGELWSKFVSFAKSHNAVFPIDTSAGRHVVESVVRRWEDVLGSALKSAPSNLTPEQESLKRHLLDESSRPVEDIVERAVEAPLVRETKQQLADVADAAAMRKRSDAVLPKPAASAVSSHIVFLIVRQNSVVDEMPSELLRVVHQSDLVALLTARRNSKS